jgi:hypothetical protein
MKLNYYVIRFYLLLSYLMYGLNAKLRKRSYSHNIEESGFYFIKYAKRNHLISE